MSMWDRVGDAAGCAGSIGVVLWVVLALFGLDDVAMPALIFALACVAVSLLSAVCTGVQPQDDEDDEIEDDLPDTRMHYMGDDMTDEEWEDYLDEISRTEDWL